MKTFYCYLILILLFTSCNKHVNFEITLKGQIKNSDSKEVFLKSYNLTLNAPVDKDGNFILKFTSQDPHLYQFNDNLNLFLIPGDNVTINKNGEDYTFSGGQSALLSKYYLDWEKYWNKFMNDFDEKKYYSQEPEDFTKTIYRNLDIAKVSLKELLKKTKNINPEFNRLENERLKYLMIWDFLDYEYENYKKYTGKEPIINELFHNYMNDVNLNDSSLLQLESYKGFLVSYFEYMTVKQFKNQTDIFTDKYNETAIILNSMSSEIKNQKVLDYLTHKVIYDRTNDLLVNDKNLILFKQLCKNQNYIQEIEKKYTELKVLMPGNPAPDFILYDANKKKYKISDFRGKFLLIDVWGVFCGPCTREAPFINQIEQDFKGKNIEFVGACLDNSTELWTNKVKALDLKGTQLFVKGGWNSQFKKDYQIYWIPTYILIDKSGKIIDARAPRPSNNLRDLLNKTLENKTLKVNLMINN